MKKGEIACYKQFLLFFTMFSTLHGIYFSIYTHFEMLSATSFKLDQSKILSSGNGLSIFFTWYGSDINTVIQEIILYHIIACFNNPEMKELWKMQGKDTLPITSNFSFSDNFVQSLYS